MCVNSRGQSVKNTEFLRWFRGKSDLALCQLCCIFADDSECPMRYINIIVICSVLPPDKANEQTSEWKRPFHYVISEDGTVERTRPISKAACGCPGKNAHAVTIAYTGGIGHDGRPTDTRTHEQRQSMLQLVTRLTKFYRCRTINLGDITGTASPGFDATREYAGILKQVIHLP